MSFGHCGIDWLHSLLDSHPQLLIPPAFSPYRNWKLLNAEKIKTAEDMHRLWFEYLTGPEMQGKDSKFFYSENETALFNKRLHENLMQNGIARLSVILSILDAYAYAKNIDASKVQAVILHEHVCYPFFEILNDINHPKVLMIARDPRAAIAGYFKGMNKKFGDRPDYYDYYFDMSLEEWLCACDIWNQYGRKNLDTFKVVTNEKMHHDLEFEMRDIANWLNIDFQAVLLQSTYPNDKNWTVDSCYISRDGKYPETEESFFFPENIRRRWQQELSNPREVVMIEILFGNFMDEFGYERQFPNSWINRLKGLLSFLPPHRGPLRFEHYPLNTDEIMRTIHRVQKKNRCFQARLWQSLPLWLMSYWLWIGAVAKHLSICFTPGNRWKRYDNPGLY